MLVEHSERSFTANPIWQSVDQTAKRAIQRLAQALVLEARANTRAASPSRQVTSPEATAISYHLSNIEGSLNSSYLSSNVLRGFLGTLEKGDVHTHRRSGLGSYLSSSRVDMMSRTASPEAVHPPEVVSIKRWISLLVAVRQHAVLMLDGLAHIYCLQQAALRYWGWARRNPVSFRAHKVLSIPYLLPYGTWTAFGPLITLTNRFTEWKSDDEIEAGTASHQLRRLEDWIVKCIGVIHTAISTMSLSLTSYATSIVSLSGSVDEDDTDVASGVDHVLQTIIRKTLSNMHMCPMLRTAVATPDEGSPMSVKSPVTAGGIFGEPSITFEGLIGQLRHQIDWFEESKTMTLHDLSSPSLAAPPGRLWRRVASLFVMVVPIAVYTWNTTPEATLSHIRWVRGVITTFYLGYVQEPMVAAYDSFTSVRPGAAQRKQEIEEDLNSTVRMVLDFYRDTAEGLSTVEGRAEMERAVREGDMSMINGRYEAAVRHPFRSFFFGSLVRLMLIQIQHQKLEVSRVLSASDDVLESNDFNFKVMALLPFVALVSLSLHYAATRSRYKRDPVYYRLRQCWRRLSRLLMSDEVEMRDGAKDEDICRIWDLADGVQVAHKVSSSAEVSTGEQGRMLLLIHEMRALLGCIPEYPLLDEILEDLRDVESVEATRGRRLQVVNRMLSTHPILNPLYISK